MAPDMEKIKENEFILLKSKDDYSYSHYKMAPLSLKTGFFGTAGEGIEDSNGKITLFVDPRYHIQAEIQTKEKNVNVVKMDFKKPFLTYLKEFLPKNSTLYIPYKSTPFLFYKKLIEELNGVNIKTYDTPLDEASIDNKNEEVFEVKKNIAGKTQKEKIKKIKIENFLITDLVQIAYLLNLRSYKTNNISTFRAKLFIKNESEVYLFTDYKTPIDFDFLIKKPIKEFENFIKNFDGEILIDEASISLFDYLLIKNPVFIKNNPIVQMKSKKNKFELNHFKESFKRLDLALYSFREKIKEGLSEFELNQIFESELKKFGADGTSFKTILAIGENSSIIHYTANSKEKILKKGDVLLLDCGGYYEGGYATDITRAFYCKGKTPDDKLKEIYTAVLKAQLNIYHSTILNCFELHMLAVKYLKKYQKEGFLFPHGLGHGVGIEVHEAPPTLSVNSKYKLKNNNIFTIEPGLYKENHFGIRLENTVYLEKNKKVSLSHFPYEEELINYEMLNKKELKWLINWQEAAKRMYEC